MRILIFGGTGFLGLNLCENLLLKKYDVSVYNRNKSSIVITKNINKILEKVNIIHGEFAQENDFDSIVHGYDCVYHLISSTTPSKNDPMTDIDVTVKPTLKLLDACVRNKIKKVVFFSSGGTVYGIPQEIPIKESHINEPISAYGIHKLILEKYLKYYYRMYGLDYIILRIANPYGEWQRPFSSQGLIANVLGKYLTNQFVEIWGDGSIIRDYIYVKDVAEVATQVLKYTGNVKTFNIGSGKGYSINDIIMFIEKIVDNKISINRIAARKQDVSVNILDIKLAEKELAWTPKVDLENGIINMLKCWDNKNKIFG